MRIVAADVGGTHARFALAEVDDGRVLSLGEPVTLETARYATFRDAWAAFAHQVGGTVPRAAAIAVAGPVHGEVLRFTNNRWVITPSLLDAEVGIDRHLLVNDFEAIGHAVAQADATWFQRVCGPELPPASEGVTSIIGPGTGLGVALLMRLGGSYRVQATEGGHGAFPPLDEIDDAILARLRARHGRVSVERVVSGPGLPAIHHVLADIGGHALPSRDERALWGAAIEGSDALARQALDRFCMALGSAAGDIALVQGASDVVIAGGLGLRLKDILRRSGFADRFCAKGRFSEMMAGIPVRLITHPQPGLFGAAAAMARLIQLG